MNIKHMRNINIIVLIAVLTLSISYSNGYQWKRKSGGYFEAELNGIADDRSCVILRFSDGSCELMNIGDFTSNDQKYIKEFYDKKKNNELVSIQSDGMGETQSKAILDAEKSAVVFVNSEGMISDSKMFAADSEDYSIKESYTQASCGFIKNRKIISCKKDSDGIWHAKLDLQVYRYVLDNNFISSLSKEENLRRNNSINNQALFVKKLFEQYDFPKSCFDTKIMNISFSNNQCEFDCLTSCNLEKYNSFSSHLRQCLGQLAIKRGYFYIESEPFSFKKKEYPNVVQFNQHDVDCNILDLKNSEDRIFLCVCTFTSNDCRSTSWELFELPRKFMFLFEPYSHLMTGIEIKLYDKDGSVIKELPGMLPELKPYSPRTAAFTGIWDARFRSRMKDEAVIRGSQFAVFNPNKPYDYNYVFQRFRKEDKFSNVPYCRIYSIQPFFISAFPDKTNLIFPSLSRHVSVDLMPGEQRKIRKIKAEMMPIINGSLYFKELENHLGQEIE